MLHSFRTLVECRRVRSLIPAGLAFSSLLIFAGCASVPPPYDLMGQAQSSMNAARNAGAPDYDPIGWNWAQQKYRQAQSMMSTKKYEDATQLAEEAQTAADLSHAKARLARANQDIASKTAENAQLRAQIDQQDAAAAAAAASSSNASPQLLPDMPAPDSSSLGNPAAADSTINGGQ